MSQYAEKLLLRGFRPVPGTHKVCPPLFACVTCGLVFYQPPFADVREHQRGHEPVPSPQRVADAEREALRRELGEALGWNGNLLRRITPIVERALEAARANPPSASTKEGTP